jgi:ATPase subunit of ABC transporter with duplicated ATPase domains
VTFPVGELSVGQHRRLVLAGAGHAIGQRRDVLFLDEPTATYH